MNAGGFDGDIESLVDGHMSCIPEFYFVLITPLSVLVALVISQCWFLNRFRLICYQCVVVGTCGYKSNILSALIFDNYCMGRFILFLVKSQQMLILPLSSSFDIIDLNVRFLIFNIFLLHFQNSTLSMFRSWCFQLNITIFNELPI